MPPQLPHLPTNPRRLDSRIWRASTKLQVDNGVASGKLTPEGAENSKESCTAPATSENMPIAGDSVSPRKGEAAPVATPIAEDSGKCYNTVGNFDRKAQEKVQLTCSNSKLFKYNCELCVQRALQSCLISNHTNMSPLTISPLIASLPLLFCLAFHFTNATTTTTIAFNDTDTILPGHSLNTSETILSAERMFRIGFFSPENSTKLYVVIFKVTYHYVADDVFTWGDSSYDNIVWVANREHPFSNSSTILTFNSDGNLVISDGRLLHVLTNTSGGNDTYARLLDTGNLVLKNRASEVLWQSFDHPTDTLLPGMKVEDAKIGWSLTSWKSHEDPAPGLFSLQYLASRKEVVLMRGTEQYWSSPLIDQLADVFMIDGDYLTWPSTNEIRRIRLDISGNLLLQTKTWTWVRGDEYWFSFCLHYNNNINCTTTDTVRPGRSLNTSEAIVSANGRYELGFFSPENSTKYYVGIRYYNVSEGIVVWVANREHPLPNSSAVVTFNPDGNLVISGGRSLYALTNTSGGNDTYARLLDTGNLVLKNRASHIFWQSFDYPTDTLLPGMKLKDAKTGWSLTSNRSIQDPATGRFSLHYLGSRKELIVTEESEPYWISSLSGDLADIFVIDGDYITWPSNYTSDITSIRFDVSGNFILESDHINGDRYWDSTTNGTYPDCGNFSLRNDTADAGFRCYCLPGFVASLDQGCIRKTELSCRDGVQKDGFLRMSNVFWPTNHQHWYDGRPSECESACLKNCLCLGYAYDKEHRCLVWGGFVIVRFGYDPKC
ncbi:hypothetical protein FH972_020250 [Carpinus fangiana]|uniref:Bulb-type lectin domain-containing protein n=1 Tax=Carpinus fangiana TaxID=176857 RepID=A0A5N6RW48_9ROSI|nr:hypothetical protein FH972_020250 [Carpinus fangiana]